MALDFGAGDPTLRLVDAPEPELGPRQVAVAVRAASVNRADLLQRAGSYLPGGTPTVVRAGLDAAGEVVAVGELVEAVAVGQRVMTMAPGGLAEKVVVDEGMAVPLPEDWSNVEGAAAIVALMTAHNALTTAGRFQPGESVLVHGAASGVGLQTVQLSRFLGAGTIIATTRSGRAAELLRRLGAHVVDVAQEDFPSAVGGTVGERGVDVVVDHVGGPYLAGNLTCLAVRGRLISVGRLGGGAGDLDMDTLALKRLEIIGVTFRTRDAGEKAAIAAGVRELLDTAGASDALRPTVDRTLPWTRVADAYELMERNAHLGKIVLDVVATP
ncbi:MAG: zinc-binding dehydrogenase [Propionibacteriales bacterium]|nr:zinc-binding dehydrogenase [Propionibacteriales bacterium]